MTAVTRRTSLQYGSTVVGKSSTKYLINGKIRIRVDWPSFEVSLQVDVSSTPANIETDTTDLIDAFRTPNQTLTVKRGDNADIADDDVVFTAKLNSLPIIEKTGETTDTNRSRSFDITISGEMPADKNSRDGRREAEQEVLIDASGVHEITFSGIWTATSSGSDALDEYNANIDAYANAFLNTIGSSSTYEVVEDIPVPDDNDNIVRFTRRYREVIHNQSSGTFNDAAIKKQTISLQRDEIGPEDSGPIDFNRAGLAVSRLHRGRAQAIMNIDQAVSTDLEGIGDSQIQFLLNLVRSTFQTSRIAVINKSVQPEKQGNLLTVSLEFFYMNRGHAVYKMDLSVRVIEDPGQFFTGFWNRNAQNRNFTKKVDQGLSTRKREISEVWEIAGEGRPLSKQGHEDIFSGRPAQVAWAQASVFQSPNWNTGPSDVTEEPIFIGDPPNRIKGTRYRIFTTQEYFEPPAGPGGTQVRGRFDPTTGQIVETGSSGRTIS